MKKLMLEKIVTNKGVGFSDRDWEDAEIDFMRLHGYELNFSLMENQRYVAFKAHETFLVRLCEILKVPYEDTSEADILAKVKELREIRDGLEYDPYRMRWRSK